MAFWNKANPAAGELDHAIAAWRRAEVPEPRLSEQARAGIVRQARTAPGAGRPDALRSLFVPTSRLALGTAVPLGALSALLAVVLVLQGGVVPGDLAKGGPRIEATKVGSDVVFVIRNGERVHTVSKSSDPGQFGPHAQVRTEAGRFRDRLDESSPIVYYRID